MLTEMPQLSPSDLGLAKSGEQKEGGNMTTSEPNEADAEEIVPVFEDDVDQKNRAGLYTPAVASEPTQADEASKDTQAETVASEGTEHISEQEERRQKVEDLFERVGELSLRIKTSDGVRSFILSDANTPQMINDFILGAGLRRWLASGLDRIPDSADATIRIKDGGGQVKLIENDQAVVSFDVVHIGIDPQLTSLFASRGFFLPVGEDKFHPDEFESATRAGRVVVRDPNNNIYEVHGDYNTSDQALNVVSFDPDNPRMKPMDGAAGQSIHLDSLSDWYVLKEAELLPENEQDKKDFEITDDGKIVLRYAAGNGPRRATVIGVSSKPYKFTTQSGTFDIVILDLGPKVENGQDVGPNTLVRIKFSDAQHEQLREFTRPMIEWRTLFIQDRGHTLE